MSRMRRHIAALAVTAAGVSTTVALAAPAQAAPPSISVRAIGTNVAVVGTLRTDQITLRNSGKTLAVSSPTQRVKAGSGCIQVKKRVVTCTGVTFVKIVARAGDDNIRNNDNTLFTDISAGDGRDRVSGGPGRDVMDGGSDDDILIGGRGLDSINGGPGRDSCAGETEFKCER